MIFAGVRGGKYRTMGPLLPEIFWLSEEKRSNLRMCNVIYGNFYHVNVQGLYCTVVCALQRESFTLLLQLYSICTESVENDKMRAF